MRAVRRVTDTRDRGSALGEGTPGHTTGYVEAGRVPGKPRLRRGSGRALSLAWGPAAVLAGAHWEGVRSDAAGRGRARSDAGPVHRGRALLPAPARRPRARPRPATCGCSGQGHKRLITAAALTGAVVTVSGACPRRRIRRLLQRATLDALMSVTVALERPAAAPRTTGSYPCRLAGPGN